VLKNHDYFPMSCEKEFDFYVFCGIIIGNIREEVWGEERVLSEL